jgi:hypothetical protein
MTLKMDTIYDIFLSFLIADEGIKILTKKQDQLQRLELQNMKKLTDKALMNVSSPVLEIVDLQRCVTLTSAGEWSCHFYPYLTLSAPLHHPLKSSIPPRPFIFLLPVSFKVRYSHVQYYFWLQE